MFSFGSAQMGGGVICQILKLRIDCREAFIYSQVPGHELKASKEMVMVSLMYGVIARLGAEGNIFFLKM